MFKLIPSLLLALPILIACTSVASDEPRGAAKFADDPRLGEQVDKICFKRSIDGFSNATRDTVVLSAGVNEDYLVEVFGGCTNLRHAQRIAIDSSLSCVDDGDFLIVSENLFSDGRSSGLDPQRCAIDSIYKWDKRAEMAEDDNSAEN